MWLKPWYAAIQMEAMEQYFHVVRVLCYTFVAEQLPGLQPTATGKKATVYFARKPTCARCQFNFSLPKHIFFKFFVACSDLVFFLFFLLLFLCNFLNNKTTVTSNVVEFSIARQIKNNLQHINQEQVMIDQFAPLGCTQDKIFLAHAGCSSSFNFSSEMISSVGSPSNSASSCIESCRVSDLRERDGFPKQNEI